jgi:putative spermidine/putrescine transport system permease protein
MRPLTPYASKSERAGRIGFYLLCALIFAFLVAPLAAIVPLSFNAGSFLSYPLAGYSLRWYEQLVGSQTWLVAFRNSVLVALCVTGLATALGTLAALALGRFTAVWKPALIALLLAPMFIPVIIVAVATYYLYAPLGLANSFAGLVLAHTTLAAPLVVVVMHAALRGFDGGLLRAAASLGARPVMVFFRILLPLLAPGVIASAVLAFVTSFDEIVMALFLAGAGQKTLPLKMYEGVRDEIDPTITAAATLLIVISVVLLAAVEMLRRRRERLYGSAR